MQPPSSLFSGLPSCTILLQFFLYCGNVAQDLSPRRSISENQDLNLIPKRGEKSLWHHGSPPSRIKPNITQLASLGKPLTMSCTIASSIQDCSWTSPNQGYFNMTNLPPGINGSSSELTCQLEIAAISEEHLGTWSCQILMSGSAQFQQAFLAATQKLPLTDVRLPTHIKPDTYYLFVIPYLIKDNFTYDGHVDIIIDALECADNITLHIDNITIFENLVTLLDISDDKYVPIQGHGYDSKREFYIVKAEVVLGHKYRLSIPFLGHLNDDLAGFYKSTYFDKQANETRYLATTQMEPTHARRAFPCFDEPALKAKFLLTIGRMKTMTSLGNMPILHEGIPMAGYDEYVWDQYEMTAKMSTYLVAFVVSDFNYTEASATKSGVEFRIWSREEALPFTNYAQSIGPKVLEFYESYFNVSFPLPKQAMIAIPDFNPGAMENWGLITYRETSLLYDPTFDGIEERIFTCKVVAHELAHMWFGDLVTMKWWDDLWLNEGFATYMQVLGAHHVEEKAGIKDRFSVDHTHVTFDLDSLVSSHPISATVRHPDEIRENFDKISYSKGASIIRMMAHFLGEDNFAKGLSRFLKRHQFGNADQGDLWNAWSDMAIISHDSDVNVTIKEIMDTWTHQMGYPVINVTRHYQSYSMTITQMRYLSESPDPTDGVTNMTVSSLDYKWWVPITFALEAGDFSTDNKTTYWLGPNDDCITIELPPDSYDKAVIVNVQQSGYYRVNYDLTNWEKIFTALKENPESIHKVNKGQVINDVFNLAKVGIVPYDVAMASMHAMIKEQDYIPWKAYLVAISHLKLMFRNKSGYGYLRKYLLSLLQHPYSEIELDFHNYDSPLYLAHQNDIINEMCDLDYTQCQNHAHNTFIEWMNSPDPNETNPINPNMRNTVYCHAVALGDEREWMFLWERLKSAHHANEKENIMYGLACSNKVWLLEFYLEQTLDPKSPLRKQDGATVIANIARNQLGKYLTWVWLRNGWEQVAYYFAGRTVPKIIEAVTSEFNTVQEVKALKAFYDGHVAVLGKHKSATLKAIEKAKANTQWMVSHYDKILTWIKAVVGEDL